jgi:hypothetical protein
MTKLELLFDLAVAFVFLIIFVKTTSKKKCLEIFVIISAITVGHVLWRSFAHEISILDSALLNYSNRSVGGTRVSYILVLSSFLSFIFLSSKDYLSRKKKKNEPPKSPT